MFFRKKAILFIHGFVGGIYDFGTLHNELQLYKNFDVFTYTLKAHDKLIVKDVEYKEWIDESTKQIEFLINNGYKEIYLIGHSMGGVIASNLASKYHEVKKIVLAAPAFRIFCFKSGKLDIKSFNNSLKNIPEIIKGQGREQVLSKLIKTPIPTTIELTKLINHYQSCVNEITCDTLIIHGTEDNIVPRESTEYVHNSIKSKTNILINVQGLNHDCFISNRSDELNYIIKELERIIKKNFWRNF